MPTSTYGWFSLTGVTIRCGSFQHRAPWTAPSRRCSLTPHSDVDSANTHVCASVEGKLRQSVEFLQLEHGALLLFPLSVRLSEVWVAHKELMSDPQRCHHRYEASRSVISSEHEITKDNSVLGYDHMILSCWSGAAAVSVCQPGRWKIGKKKPIRIYSVDSQDTQSLILHFSFIHCLPAS